jgi:hypothetical protein
MPLTLNKSSGLHTERVFEHIQRLTETLISPLFCIARACECEQDVVCQRRASERSCAHVGTGRLRASVGTAKMLVLTGRIYAKNVR